MYRRVIPLQVADEYVLGDGVPVGAAGSHDDVALRLAFGPMWAGTARSIVWYDANGENPTITALTTDMLAEGESEVYLVPIPAQAKAAAGQMFMTIKGATVSGEKETTATLTTTARFPVMESDWSEDAEKSGDITPTQAEQFRAEIETIKTGIVEAKAAGASAAQSEQKAAQSEAAAASSASAAAASEAAAAASASQAETAQSKAGSAQAAAQTAQAAAESAQTAAETAQEAAEAAQGEAESARSAAAESAQAAEKSASSAAESAQEAAESETAAQGYAGSAAGSAADAEACKAAAADSQAGAAESAVTAESWAVGGTGTREGEDTDNAKYWAKQAEAAAGGDFATKLEAQGYVSTHNGSGDAHADLRQAIAGKETAGAAAAVQANLDRHMGDAVTHVTAAERTKWNAKADAAALDAHTGDADNPHGVTKAQVGLGDADNTSDADKPVSTAQQAALDKKQDKLTGSSGQLVGFDDQGNAAAVEGDSAKVGDTICTMRTDLGEKWLLCNGDVISETEYPDLIPYLSKTYAGTYAGSDDPGTWVKHLGDYYFGSAGWATSPNGPWTPYSFGSYAICDAAYGGGYYVVAGATSTSYSRAFHAYTTDPAAGWTPVISPDYTSSSNTAGIWFLKYVSTLWVAIYQWGSKGNSGAYTLRYTSDLTSSIESWSTIGAPLGISKAIPDDFDMDYADGKYRAIAHQSAEFYYQISDTLSDFKTYHTKYTYTKLYTITLARILPNGDAIVIGFENATSYCEFTPKIIIFSYESDTVKEKELYPYFDISSEYLACQWDEGRLYVVNQSAVSVLDWETKNVIAIHYFDSPITSIYTSGAWPLLDNSNDTFLGTVDGSDYLYTLHNCLPLIPGTAYTYIKAKEGS